MSTTSDRIDAIWRRVSFMPAIAALVVGVTFLTGGFPDWVPGKVMGYGYGVALVLIGAFTLRSWIRDLRRLRAAGEAAEMRERHDAIQRAAFPYRPRSS